MSNKKNNSLVVSNSCPHTMLKFQLIEKYVARRSKVLSASKLCEWLIFIDPMSNSGIYRDSNTNAEIEGTTLRVANILKDEATKNPNIKILMLVNDISQSKINRLKIESTVRELQDTDNFKIVTSCEDKCDFLKSIGKNLKQNRKSTIHTLLFYDPYDADIDWEVIEPFINRWGEVIINHFISDPVRGLSQAKDKLLVYERTYKTTSEQLRNEFSSDPSEYRERLREIVRVIRNYKPDEYFISGFPFFNRVNGLLYEIVHLTSHQKGFNLFKSSAWETFNGHSSNKNRKADDDQLTLMLGDYLPGDSSCYTIQNIADFLIHEHRGKDKVFIPELYKPLEYHEIFPSGCFKKEIKDFLLAKGVKKSRQGRKEVYDFSNLE